MMEKTIEVVKFIPQERVQNRTVEQIIDVPVKGKSTCKPNPITMTSEEEHLSQTETRHVTQEAEEHRDENEVNKTKVEAKNGLENHCATTRSTSIAEQMKSKFEVGHKKKNTRSRSCSCPEPVGQESVGGETGGFEAKQYPQDAQEKADLTNQRQVPAIRSVQKTVEVPRVQYIDKVADIPVDMQGHGSTTQASQHDMQHIDEVVHVPALMESEVPTVPGH